VRLPEFDIGLVIWQQEDAPQEPNEAYWVKHGGNVLLEVSLPTMQRAPLSYTSPRVLADKCHVVRVVTVRRQG
jgi:hypothetical protein